MDELCRYYAKWNKPLTKEQMPYDLLPYLSMESSHIHNPLDTGEEFGVTAQWAQSFSGGIWKHVEMEGGDGTTIMYIYWRPLNYAFKIPTLFYVYFTI